MISVIVSIYDEETILAGNTHKFCALGEHAELIFVDGGSSDKSAEIASRCGRTFCSPKGRALQMNHGARGAGGDTLLFLHADTTILPQTLNSIETQIRKNGFVGGCLTQRIDSKKIIYRFIESHGNIRARIKKIFYGDQGIFVTKEAFLKAGGFPAVPIMEDVLFTKKLRKLGKVTVLPDEILVSSRRWDKGGILKTILIHNLIVALFCFKFPLQKIKKLYGDVR